MYMSTSKLILWTTAALMLSGCATTEKSPRYTGELKDHPWARWANCVQYTMEFEKCHDLYVK